VKSQDIEGKQGPYLLADEGDRWIVYSVAGNDVDDPRILVADGFEGFLSGWDVIEQVLNLKSWLRD
jgi:hypothetical protein